MKSWILFLMLLVPFSIFAQEASKQKSAQSEIPIDNAKEEQQAMDKNTVNEYDVGPYDREGKYLNYSRMQEEMKAAKDGTTIEQEQ